MGIVKAFTTIIIISLLFFTLAYAYHNNYLPSKKHILSHMHFVKIKTGKNIHAKWVITSPYTGTIIFDGGDNVEYNDGNITIHTGSYFAGYALYTYFLHIPLHPSYRQKILSEFEESFHTTLPLDYSDLEKMYPSIHRTLTYNSIHAYWRITPTPHQTVTGRFGDFVGYRAPDQVLQNHGGMCIEYAILWAAIYLAEGYTVTYVYIQGYGQHAFIVNQDGVVIENYLYLRPNLSDELSFYEQEFGPLQVTMIVYAPNDPTFVSTTMFEYK